MERFLLGGRSGSQLLYGVLSDMPSAIPKPGMRAARWTTALCLLGCTTLKPGSDTAAPADSSVAPGSAGSMGTGAGTDAGPKTEGGVPPDAGGGATPDAEPDAGAGAGAGAGGTTDGGTADACIRAPESCNRSDDDCDGEVDEDAVAACERIILNAEAECVAIGNSARCVMKDDCRPGFYNCDGNLANGCEPYCECHDCADVRSCEATTPSYRSASCDSCACSNCGSLVAQCQNHPDPSWAQHCRDLIECIVISDAMGQCNGGDCYMNGSGPCAYEFHDAAGGADHVITGCASGDFTPAAACGAALNFNDCAATTCAADCCFWRAIAISCGD
jgi:hypothetical protein